MSTTTDKLMESMYEYEMVTPHQLAIIHGYTKGSVYTFLNKLDKLEKIQKADMPVLGRGSKAYFLTVDSARSVAQARDEMHLFKEKEWEHPPGSILNTLMSNQVFCELIIRTREIPGAGLAEWRGKRSTAHVYQVKLADPKNKKEEAKVIPQMDGNAEFYYNDHKYHIHLDVFTGIETPSVIENVLLSHIQTIQAYWNNPEKALLLLPYLQRRTGDRILDIWQQLVGGKKGTPFLGVAPFEDIMSAGGLANVWQVPNQEDRMSITNMPSVEASALGKELIGKQTKVKFQFSNIGGFQSEKQRDTKQQYEKGNTKELTDEDVAKTDIDDNKLVAKEFAIFEQGD